MNDAQKKSLTAIHVAALALSAATAALVSTFGDETPAPAAAAPKPPKEATKPPKEATKPAEPAAAAPAGNGAEDLSSQCRKAAKSYAETFGREGLKEVLSKFTDKTLADVPADKLPELLKALS